MNKRCIRFGENDRNASAQRVTVEAAMIFIARPQSVVTMMVDMVGFHLILDWAHAIRMTALTVEQCTSAERYKVKHYMAMHHSRFMTTSWIICILIVRIFDRMSRYVWMVSGFLHQMKLPVED